SYSGVITLSATGATPVTVPVTFTVAAAPTISLSPTSLTYTATQEIGRASCREKQAISLSNKGGGTLSWSASDNAAWLTLTLASGTAYDTVTWTASTRTLSPCSYSGVITLSATGATPVTVPVTFTVAAAPTISLSPTSLTYTATQ